METVRLTNEDEMVAAFLQAEIRSSRWPEKIRSWFPVCGVTEAMLQEPDTTDADANAKRSTLLGNFRGWRRNAMLFEGWPDDAVQWSLVRLGADDFPNVRYANTGEWPDLSNGTLRPSETARRIASDDPTLPEYPVISAIRDIVDTIRRGENLPPLVVIGPSDGSLIALVEGHARFTAQTIVGDVDREIDTFFAYGLPAALRTWRHLPLGL